MAKFILNRPDDSLSMFRKQIIRTALKWLLLLIGGAVVLRIACVSAYMSMGLNPMDLTKFGGDPRIHMAGATWKTLFKLMIIAPFAEEAMFRLGLSFKKTTVGLWIGLLPVIIAAYLHDCRGWYILLGLVIAGALLFWLVYRFTTDEQWKEWRGKFIVPAMWISAIGFGQYGSPEEAEHYRPLFPGCEVIGFDYKAETPWEAEREFAEYFDGLTESRRRSIGIITNSIGAFYAMCALAGKDIAAAYFISPIVDLERIEGVTLDEWIQRTSLAASYLNRSSSETEWLTTSL